MIWQTCASAWAACAVTPALRFLPVSSVKSPPDWRRKAAAAALCERTSRDGPTTAAAERRASEPALLLLLPLQRRSKSSRTLLHQCCCACACWHKCVCVLGLVDLDVSTVPEPTWQQQRNTHQRSRGTCGSAVCGDSRHTCAHTSWGPFRWSRSTQDRRRHVKHKTGQQKTTQVKHRSNQGRKQTSKQTHSSG
jgi:hypothetical protein